MEPATDCAVKTGIVHHLDEHTVYVKITTLSACASCHAKGACTSADSSERLVEVDRDSLSDLVPGQQVTLSAAKGSEFRAILFGYILPFLVVLISLLIAINFTSEAIAGLISLTLLVPYYALLYIFKMKMKKRFGFTILQ